MSGGILAGIFVAPVKGGPLHPVEYARAIPDKGLEGDRYGSKTGTYSKKEKPGRELTLIEAEALEGLERDYGLKLPPHETRRNLLTRGVALNHLIGREFAIGAVRLRGIELCEPCGHLEKLSGKSVRAGLVHRGGIRAQILSEGVIRVGDKIEQRA